MPRVNRPSRIAWLGPAPEDRGGVPAMARDALTGLADAGAELELFLDSPRTPILDDLHARANVRITRTPSSSDGHSPIRRHSSAGSNLSCFRWASSRTISTTAS